VEPGEWCDGESFCDSNCAIHRYACCEFSTSGGACSSVAFPYTFHAYQYTECGQYGGTLYIGKTVPAGGACANPPSGPPYAIVDGACVEPPPLPAPIDLCCQNTGSCTGSGSTADNDAITTFIYLCGSNHANEFFIPIVRGTCGGDGNCVFAP
jgi:hypothetical protein